MPNLLRTIPEERREERSEVSDRGTRIHHARETGHVLDLQDDGEVSAYHTGLHNEGIILSNWRNDFGIVETQEERELRLWLYQPGTFQAIASGKLDVLYLALPHLLVVDWKSFSGISAGRARDSWQLRFYAVVAAKEYGAAHVRAVFNKPEAWSRYQIDVCDFDRQALEYYEYLIRWHLWFATLPDAPRRAGEWCNWCPCKAYCPEAGAMAMLPLAQSEGGILARVDTLPPLALRKLWEQSTIITKVLARVDDRIRSLPERTLEEIGLRLGKERETEVIEKVPEAFGRLVQAGLTPQDVLKCMKMPKGDLIDLIRREFAFSSDAKAANWLARQIGEFIETKTGKPSIKEARQ